MDKTPIRDQSKDLELNKILRIDVDNLQSAVSLMKAKSKKDAERFDPHS